MAKQKTIWEKSDPRALEQFCEEYRQFLSAHKTERENVTGITAMLKKAGAKRLADLTGARRKPRKGDLVYADMMGKSLLIFRIGKSP